MKEKIKICRSRHSITNLKLNIDRTYSKKAQYLRIYQERRKEDNSLKNITLKGRLYILILAILIPFLLLQLMGIYNRYQHVVQSELEASEELGEAIKIIFKNHLENLWEVEKNIYLAIQLDLPIEEIGVFLKDLLKQYPSVSVFKWVNADLQLKLSTNGLSDKGSFSDQQYVQQILRGEEKVVSNLIKKETTGQLIYIIARGFWAQGSFQGMAIAEIDVGKLKTVFPINRSGKTKDFGLADRNGMIIYRSTNPELSFAERILTDNSPFLLALQGEAVKVTGYQSLSGDMRIGVSLPLEQAKWAVFTSVGLQEVIADLKSDSINSTLIFLSITLITLVIGLVGINNFMRPILALQGAVQAAAQGDFSARTEINAGGEIAKTGKLFNRMATYIQELQADWVKFIQTAMHELRNPMAGIKGILSLIRRRVETDKPVDNILELLDVMEREIDRLSNLLNQTLEAFRTQQEEIILSLNLQPINLVEVVRLALRPFEVSTEKKIFTFTSDYPEINILGDFARLEEVFHNLLSNAIKYSPVDSEIEVKINLVNDHVIASVKDYGIGIPEEQVYKIFEGFYRASNLPAHDPGGMGLGLYICQQIIQRHNGQIWVENNLSSGSTFFIKFLLYKPRRNSHG